MRPNRSHQHRANHLVFEDVPDSDTSGASTPRHHSLHPRTPSPPLHAQRCKKQRVSNQVFIEDVPDHTPPKTLRVEHTYLTDTSRRHTIKDIQHLSLSPDGSSSSRPRFHSEPSAVHDDLTSQEYNMMMGDYMVYAEDVYCADQADVSSSESSDESEEEVLTRDKP
ncbi:hypothetical protein M422DRAFT_270738 [Sphaerobolus stellatus SS14]|uniref:Uncharacterized protein n=1 Tax=Sphaerobolus stellatus (strain SS14) TaxID=990650 RepID=A0A0C9U1U7_SPHS4|nr:hypothetical protein M422DRAFT_270738 [Sphaerobolus stellatus SS14]